VSPIEFDAATLRSVKVLRARAQPIPITMPAICPSFIAAVYPEKSGEVLSKNHLTNIIDH
jgi:hypothetical protein